MLAAERHRAIEQLVNSKGIVRVRDLSQLLGVAAETIRRDLDSLESGGKLRRSHGGAISIVNNHNEAPYAERETVNVAEKLEIARLAVQQIVPGDHIALDASTTVCSLVSELTNMPLTVLTNSLQVAYLLSRHDKIEVITTGGILRSNSLSYVGPLAEEMMLRFHVNKAFISCRGLHVEHGITEANDLQTLVKKKMVAIADEVFLLADHTKIQMQDFVHFMPLGDIDVLITDSGAIAGNWMTLKNWA
jgi:DeoR/GlpR family transcriptional regulator of sugar metabolism